MEFGNPRDLDELNDRLRANCFIRRLKADVLKELPAKQMARVPLALANAAEYRRAEEAFLEWLEEKGEDVEAAQRAEHLVRIEKLKQLAAAGKLEEAIRWIRDFLESGEKLVVFATHRDVVARLATEFSAPSITGETPLADRQAAVDRFQSDPECRVIVLNTRAGGVGLTLTAASNVAFLELGWTPAEHDQAEDRCHRIGQERSVTAWYLLADGTIDAEIETLLEAKRTIVEAVTEGKAGNLGILGDLIERLKGRRRS